METNPRFQANAPLPRVYVGCRTTQLRNARGKAIEVYEQVSDGSWRHAHSTPAGENPSYLAIDPSERFLHAVHGDGSTVSSFAIAADGRLQALSSQYTLGVNPVHLCFSPCGQWVVIANYASGSVVSLPVQNEGHLGEVVSKLQLPDTPGPHRKQQRGAHPHQVVFSPCGNWLLVPDKGADAIHTLGLDPTTGQLRRVGTLLTAPGSGPRHLVFDKTGQHAWVVLELSSQTLAMHFDSVTGQLQPFQRLSSVPESFTGENIGAGIVLSPAGTELCVSNRGHSSICIYAIDPITAALASPRWIWAGGKTPRFICVAQSASHPWQLAIANEDTHDIVCASIDKLMPPHTTLAHTGSPVCLVFTPQR